MIKRKSSFAASQILITHPRIGKKSASSWYTEKSEHMSLRKTWKPYVYRMIALVAAIQIIIIQLNFFARNDECFTSFSTSIENAVGNIHDVDYAFDKRNKSDALENVPEKNNEDNFSQKIHHTENYDNNAHSSTASSVVLDEPDGTFMDYPIYYRSPSELQSFHSTSHCIGDNFIEKESWKSKSCQFKNLCFDTISHEFVTFASTQQLQLERTLSNRSLTFFSPSSTMLNNSVSIGGLNPKWSHDTHRMKWFPELLDVNNILLPYNGTDGGIYVLPKDVVMVPFHSLAGMNVGHLLWDDWLPLYTILDTFDFLDHKPLFIRYILKRQQWASCDYHKNVKECARMMSKFLPLLGVGNTNSENKLWTIHDFNFTVRNSESNDGRAKSRYVCGENGLAGLGIMTDHGFKLHGWNPKDYKTTHNMNRGGSLYRFRNYMMKNIGLSTAPLQNINEKTKLQIVFSTYSSTNWARQTNFAVHASRLESDLSQKYNIDIKRVQLASMTLMEQVKLLSRTSILVTVCGGGATTSIFLPKGAALIAFFNDEEGERKTPARLDWDMFNSIGYIRTHWLPRVRKSERKPFIASSSGPRQIDFDAFVHLVEHELDIISHL